MAITSTLSRLKNYFIGWHTANYETLHLLTDEITNDENDPRSRYAIRSRAIKNLTGDRDDQEGDTVWGNINKLWNNVNNLWNNVNNLWAKIGDSCDTYFGTGGTYSPHLTISCQIKHIWDNLGNWGDATDMDNPADPKTIWGWIHKFMLTTENLRSRTTNLENRTDKYVHLYMNADKKDGVAEIDFYRAGRFCYIHGWFNPNRAGDKQVWQILDAEHPAFRHFKPKNSTYFSFNQVYPEIKTIQIGNHKRASNGDIESLDNGHYFTIYMTAKKSFAAIDVHYFSGVYLAHDENSLSTETKTEYTRIAYYKERAQYPNDLSKWKTYVTDWNSW